ncbi:hypothetical protein A5707_14915 [Mycobacterium kyorinense]|uniref:DUF4873 domain-containing protein n=1 Tax=Mycobacterium kyorinense TaxID=487514 RepID=A0A1A2ZJG5_9MYCO|nr:hypothetical protein A5707_14915 [Mycobacterium kyorinense]
MDNVVVVGSASAAAKLRDAGITDFTLVDREVVSSVFDDETATWTVATNGGETCRGGVVVACTSPFVPWIPDLPGRNDFRGPAVAAAAGDTPFDPTGKRVAVIGGDFAAGQWVDRLTPSAASVEIFPYSPRRAIRTNRRRWRRRRTSVTPMRSPIDVITASGIRTRDGAHHDVDAIIYGTGFAVRKQLRQDTLVGAQGLRIQEAWQDGMEPYLGVAIHGFPNYFLATAPDSERYVAECLRLMHRSGSTRIEVRRSSAQTFNEYVNTGRPRNLKASAFDLASGAQLHDETYAGPATLTIAGTCREVRVHLTGHVDPIDGQYHWQGTVFDQLPPDLLRQARTATLAVGERNSSARITEATPQGGYSIAGAGPPPFALTNTELAVQRP